MTDRSPLRQAIDTAIAETGCSMKDLTVLATQNDPFRLDTPARHRDGEWLAVTARELGLGDRKIHLRGLHYMVIGRPKPDGTPYANTDADWLWLQADAGKAARFLGYLPFDQITDQRNTAPTIRIVDRPEPWPYLRMGLQVDIPDVDDLAPEIDVDDFRGVQPFRLVLFGEKSSLADTLTPIAERYDADLYLPTGEMSDTMLHTMATTGADDGRPMVVLCFSDCDPAGWQMPISISRKLQAFKAGLFPALDYQVHRVALGPEQVREYGLPSTPLKDTEKRGDKWRQAMGVEQTEIDALASLRPELLRQIATDAIAPFYDGTLRERVYDAEREWIEQAQAVVDDAIDPELMRRIRTDAAAKLASMREEIDTLNRAVRIDPGEINLPTPIVPDAHVPTVVHGLPLLDSRWSFVDQCKALKASRAYETTAAAAAAAGGRDE